LRLRSKSPATWAAYCDATPVAVAVSDMVLTTLLRLTAREQRALLRVRTQTSVFHRLVSWAQQQLLLQAIL
jgi:hypothetical protein